MKHFQGNEYTAFGTAIHKVCEVLIPDIANKVSPLNIFKSSFKQEVAALEQLNVPLDQDLISKMIEQAKPICEQILPAVKEHFGNFQVVSVEEEILEPITEFDSHGTSFKGFIDMVIKVKDGKYYIIDWKTCSWGWSRDKKTDPMTTYQLTYYKNYYSKKHNINPENIETFFVLLKRTAKSNNVEFVRVTSGRKKIENSLKVLENAVINIENKNYIKNRLSCKYCEFYKTEHCR